MRKSVSSHIQTPRSVPLFLSYELDEPVTSIRQRVLKGVTSCKHQS